MARSFFLASTQFKEQSVRKEKRIVELKETKEENVPTHNSFYLCLCVGSQKSYRQWAELSKTRVMMKHPADELEAEAESTGRNSFSLKRK